MEYAEAYWHETPKAKKDHKCCECGGIIEAGETYHKHRMIFEGDPSTHKVCSDCQALRNLVDKGRDIDDGTPLEGLAEAVEESNRMDWNTDFNAIKKKRRLPIKNLFKGAI